ncbi:response regulator (plasmid) [Skermanella mucosa]|nr:response regulator [Skermanella mucosa]
MKAGFRFGVGKSCSSGPQQRPLLISSAGNCLIRRWHRGNSVAAAQTRLDEQSTRFDLVLSDYQLGDGNGLQVIETVRKRWPAPAILLTGDTAPDILQQARKASVRLMHKPVPNQALRQAIAELLAVDREER